MPLLLYWVRCLYFSVACPSWCVRVCPRAWVGGIGTTLYKYCLHHPITCFPHFFTRTHLTWGPSCGTFSVYPFHSLTRVSWFSLNKTNSDLWSETRVDGIASSNIAEVPKRCSAPPQFPSIRLQNKWRTRSKFDSGEKVFYKCAEDFVAYAGSLSVMCVNGIWTALTLKCESKNMTDLFVYCTGKANLLEDSCSFYISPREGVLKLR